MMNILDYEDSGDDGESKKSVWWLLDKSMQLHKAPVLALLYMKLGPRCPSDADVGKWIAKAVDRGVICLNLDLLWSVDLITSLPKTLYFCESLETLFLSNKILVDVPSTARLPSLTNLHLDGVVYKNEDSFINLLASCPILEYLFLSREKDDNVKKFTVKSPCLLDLFYAKIGAFSNDVEDTCRCLVIDTPALTKFDFADHSGETCSIENPSCFEQVSIGALSGWSIPDTDKFLRSFSKVLSLVLNLSEEMVVCYGTIKFSRLIDCTIFPGDTDWMDSLVSLLHNAPKLKSLTVNYEFTDSPPIASVSWSKSSYDPKCLSSSLEKLELVHYRGRKEEKELVEYIITNAKCLKTVTIFMKSTLKLAEKDTMMEKLRAIPRISETSELLFKTLVHN